MWGKRNIVTLLLFLLSFFLPFSSFLPIVSLLLFPLCLFHSLCSLVDQDIQVLAPVKDFTPAPSILDTTRYLNNFYRQQCSLLLNFDLIFYKFSCNLQAAKNKNNNLMVCVCVFYFSSLSLVTSCVRWLDTPALTHSPQCLVHCTPRQRLCWTHTMPIRTPVTTSTRTRMYSTFLSHMDRTWHCGAQRWR